MVCYAALLTAIVVKLARTPAAPCRPSWVGAVGWIGGSGECVADRLSHSRRDCRCIGIVQRSLDPGVSCAAARRSSRPRVSCCCVWPGLTCEIRFRGMALGAVVGIAFNAAEGLAYSIAEIADAGGSLEPLWSDLLVRGFLTSLITHAGSRRSSVPGSVTC